jgi:hypothetical protein
MSEPVLVFCGSWRETLGIYDQRGSEIGAAIRITDRYSTVGYRHHYELRDTELRCLLRDVTRHRWSLWHTLSLLDPNGEEIAKIASSGAKSLTITADGQSIAEVRPVRRNEARIRKPPRTRQKEIGPVARLVDLVSSRKVWSVDDAPGHSVARITYLGSLTSKVAYVVVLEPNTPERLRVVALNACLAVDDTITDRSSGSGGA